MEEIIGREKQIEIFKDAINSHQSEFIAIKGRKGIGKTFLVNTVFKEEICFSMLGVQGKSMKIQLQAFADALNHRKNTIGATPKHWMDAFFQLRTYIESVKTDKKKVIFFDELQWLDASKQVDFIQTFAHFWNSWAAWTGDIILIIASSSTSWIMEKIYNDRGGFHNRVTKRIWLEPLKLAETEAFLKSKDITFSHYEILLVYMTFGGIPLYLNEVKKGESVTECIERLCFTEGGFLKNEFDNLYAATYHNPKVYQNIIKILAQNPYGVEKAELLEKTQITNTKVLEELEATGFIQKKAFYSKKDDSEQYILTDFYTRFYLTFMDNPKISNWASEINSDTYNAWAQVAFETLCHRHKKEIIKTLGINGIRTSTSYLNIKDRKGKRTDQVDMLIERADNGFNMCTIRFSNAVYALTQTEGETIRQKMFYLQKILRRHSYIYPTMITPLGCEKNMYYLGIITHQLKMDCLFENIKEMWH